MVNICIPVRDLPSQDLRLGNLRSESRWERQAIESCVLNPEVEHILTWGYEWHGGQVVTSKYAGRATRTSSEDCVLLMQDWNTEIACHYEWQGIITNIFHGPWLEQLSDIQNLVTKYGKKLIFTVGYPSLYQNQSARNHLLKFLAPENIIYLPVPGIPEGRYRDTFENNLITWAWRIIFVDTLVKAPGILWALRKLQSSPSLNLCILTGWDQDEVKDLVNGEVQKVHNLDNCFWDKEEVQPFLDVRTRCKLEYSYSWKDTLDLYGRTKILLNCTKQFGGPPLEAAMHGLPFIGTHEKEGVLCNCPDYLVAHTVAEYLVYLDRLYDDRKFYTTVGKSYYDFAIANYSYAAFGENLNKIMKERGLLI